MNFFKRVRECAKALVALSAMLMAPPAIAQWKDWDYELDQEKKSWQELQAQIPSYPKPGNLLRFDAGANTANVFFVDSASVSVGDDGVVRYTLMIKTGGGATNVSFEGIRCDTRELKIYAFGRPNSDWSRARDTRWREIMFREINNHHLTLFREHFCPTRKTIATVAQILQTLKYGPPPRSD